MKQHETDYFSLAAGLLFTVLGVLFTISAATDWIIDGRWIAPIILIALGGGGVAASLAATNRQRRVAEAAATNPSADWSAGYPPDELP
ncbi:MAG: hypothetical protein WCF04_06185 [Candidatus Nanopelagicales bacterium]